MSLYTSVMVRIHGSHKPFTKRGDIRCNISMPQNESGAGKQAKETRASKIGNTSLSANDVQVGSQMTAKSGIMKLNVLKCF